MESVVGDKTIVENIEELVPTAMRFGLVYASTVYEDNIYTPAKFTFTSGSNQYAFTGESVPLICNADGTYDLEIPYFEDLPGGNYSLAVELDIAIEKDAIDVKPYKFVINDFTVNNTAIESPYFEATLPDITMDLYSSYTIENVQSLLPSEMRFGLVYASDHF